MKYVWQRVLCVWDVPDPEKNSRLLFTEGNTYRAVEKENGVWEVHSPKTEADAAYEFSGEEFYDSFEVGDYKRETIDKIIKMFGPWSREFPVFDRKKGIYGPYSDGKVRHCTSFSIHHLMVNFGFTKDEADWFILKVFDLHNNKEPHNQEAIIK